MRPIHIPVLTAVLILLSPPAIAAEAASTDKPAEKTICKSQVQTGTRFKTKKCYTVAQWEAIEEENKRTAKEMVGPTINTDRGN